MVAICPSRARPSPPNDVRMRHAQDAGVYGTCPGGTRTWTTSFSYLTLWFLLVAPPKPQKSLFNVPSLHCYGWLTPKACNKGIVRVVAAM